MSKGEMSALRDYWAANPKLAPDWHPEKTQSAWWHPPSLEEVQPQHEEQHIADKGWELNIHPAPVREPKTSGTRYVEPNMGYGYIYRNFWAKGLPMSKSQVKVLQDHWAANPDVAPGRTKHETHVHGPAPGEHVAVTSMLIHHAPEPIVDETSAPARVPTLPHPSDNAPPHIPHMAKTP